MESDDEEDDGGGGGMASSKLASALFAVLADDDDDVNEPMADVLRGTVNRLNAFAIVEPTSMVDIFLFLPSRFEHVRSLHA